MVNPLTTGQPQGFREGKMLEDRIIQWQWLLIPFQFMWENLGWSSIPFWLIVILLGVYLYEKYFAGVRPRQ